jgi:hypothetical protein
MLVPFRGCFFLTAFFIVKIIMKNHTDDEMSEAEDCGSTAGTGKFVTELNDNDVLLGRGTGPNNNQGNVKFRVAVERLRLPYTSTSSRKMKNRIVRKTIHAVKAKNGRFLNKLRKGHIKKLGLPDKATYEVASDGVAVEKAKQALRYICYKKDAPPQKLSLPRTEIVKVKMAYNGPASVQEASSDQGTQESVTSKVKSEPVLSEVLHQIHAAVPRNRLYSDASGGTTTKFLPPTGVVAMSPSVCGPSPPFSSVLSKYHMPIAIPSPLSLASRESLLSGGVLSSVSGGAARVLPSFLPPPRDGARNLLRPQSLLQAASGSAFLAAALQQQEHDGLLVRAVLQKRAAMQAEEWYRRALILSRPSAHGTK